VCLLIADRGGEHELFHPGKVGYRARKVKRRKGEFLGSVWGFVGRFLGGKPPLGKPNALVASANMFCDRPQSPSPAY
jgi:hypothetical protein